MRRKYVYLFGVVFVLALLILFGIQYGYYRKVLSMNEEQTRRLAQQSLSEAVEDLEINEFVRVLSKDIQKDLSFHKKMEGQDLSNVLSPNMQRYLDSLQAISPDKQPLLQKEIISAYFNHGNKLDRYILKHIYGGYYYDTIPQLIPKQLLQDRVRYYLRTNGIENDFSLSLYDKSNNLIYEHFEPRMLRTSSDTLGGISQGIFIRENKDSKEQSFVRLRLDFQASSRSIFYFALPGLIYILLIVLFGIAIMTYFFKELSFQSMKASFINNMTHELKTPVSSISLAVQSLRSKQGDGRQQERLELLNILEQEGNRLHLLVEKVLQSSLLRNKKSNIHLKTLDLYEILFPIIDIYTLHVEKIKGDLELDADASDTWVRVDKMHLKNVFFNLFDNAIKYRRQDVPLKIKVIVKNTEDNILIAIEDNGIGVPKEALKKIFKRYYRVPTGNMHNVKGFGLGLAYTSDVIKNFNGTIIAQKSDSGGLRVLLSLPLVEGEEE